MTADTIGGIWTYCMDLISSLDPSDFQITLATMGVPLTSDQWEEVDEYAHLSVRESAYKLEWMDNPWEDVAEAGEWLLALEREVQPDIIHLNGYVHADLPWNAPVLVVGHSCVASWWRAVKGEPAPAQYDTYQNRVRSGLNAADMVVTPTKAMQTALTHEYGKLPLSMVIPNGRSPARFSRVKCKEPFIFSMGRLWDEAKNIRAVDLAADDLSWPVHVAGNPEHPSGGRVSLKHAHATGMLSPTEVVDYLARSSIYALPARYEPFGLSVLEAAFSRCALVLGDIPSLRENWNRRAIFVPPNDIARLHSVLRLLTEDAQLRTKLGASAYQHAHRFLLTKTGAAYKQCYRQLLGHRRIKRIPQRQFASAASHRTLRLPL